MRMPIKLSPYGVGISFNQGIKPNAPLVKSSWGDVTYDIDHLAFFLGVIELLLDPLKHRPWVGGVTK